MISSHWLYESCPILDLQTFLARSNLDVPNRERQFLFVGGVRQHTGFAQKCRQYWGGLAGGEKGEENLA